MVTFSKHTHALNSSRSQSQTSIIISMKKTTPLHHHHLLFSLTLSIFFSYISTSPLPNDTSTLTLFRLQTDTHGLLLSNWTGHDACSPSSTWNGVNCSSNNRVISLVLPSLSLRGPIASLSSLDQLRHLDLHDNRLNGSLSPLTSCVNLKLAYLSDNDFSGEIPQEISSLKRLLRLDLSSNNLGGGFPTGFGNLTRLLTLRLENNEISGQVPDLPLLLPNLKEVNFSNNEFYGRLPDNVLKKFSERSFEGNEGLCGLNPLPACSFTGDNPLNPGGGSSEIVPSNPTSVPLTPDDNITTRSHKGLRTGATVAIVITACVTTLVLASFLVAYCCRRDNSSNSKVGSENGKRRTSNGSEKRVYANGGSGYESDGTTGSDRSKLVFYDRRKQFELEDLLRASAEMLGKGSLGTVYKAVLDDGCVVAVKRLKDANPCGRKEFEQYMDVVGKMKHTNVVRFQAYYYAKEEKLLVYDYLPNGSLYSLLHGNRGPGRIPLDWTTRISLVLGAARGLSKIHEQYSQSKIPHGNIKSSNVLLDKNGIACISDFGLSLLLNPAHAIARLGGYRAPEQTETKRLSQKADVYAFGVLLLEVLTGKSPSQYPSPTRTRLDFEEDQQCVEDLPKWVRSVVKEEWTGEVFDQELLRYKNIEEELVSMLHVGLACVAIEPEKRPLMRDVVKMIEEIRVDQSPIGEEYDDSRNSISPSLATTEDGLQGY